MKEYYKKNNLIITDKHINSQFRNKYEIEYHYIYDTKQTVCIKRKGGILNAFHYFYIDMPVGNDIEKQKYIFDLLRGNISSLTSE